MSEIINEKINYFIDLTLTLFKYSETESKNSASDLNIKFILDTGICREYQLV